MRCAGAPACPTAHSQAQPPQRTKSEIKRTVVRTVQRSERCSHVNIRERGRPHSQGTDSCARVVTDLAKMVLRGTLFQLLRAASTAGASVTTGLPASSDALAFVRTLYEAPQAPQLVAFVTGGGTQLVPWLLATAGASRSVLDVQVPYSRHSLTELLGHEPAKFCSPQVASDLAAAAFERALKLSEGGAKGLPIVGMGCTAALRSEPMKRGRHRAFIAVRTAMGTHELALTFAKGARSRILEDAVVSRVALLAIAHACKLPMPGGVLADATPFWRLEGDDDQGLGSAVVAEVLHHRFVASSGVGAEGARPSVFNDSMTDD